MSLTLEECFYNHLMKEERFSVINMNLSFHVNTRARLYEITNSLEPIMVHYTTYTNVMRKLEASRSHTEN